MSDDETLEHYRELEEIHERNIRKIQKQIALHGTLNAPLHLQNELEQEQQKLREAKIHIRRILAELEEPSAIERFLSDLPKNLAMILLFLVMLALGFIFFTRILTNLAAAKVTPTEIPAEVPTEIPVETPTLSPYQTWNNNGFILTFKSENIRSNQPYIMWDMVNATNDDITIPNTFYEGFYAKDDLGNVLEVTSTLCYVDDKWMTCGNVIHPNQLIRIGQTVRAVSSNPYPKEVIFKVWDIPRQLQATFTVPVK